MRGLNIGAALAFGLLAAACASASKIAAPSIEPVGRYYKENPMPGGWQLLDVSGHNDNVFLTVAVAKSVKDAAFGQPNLGYLRYFAAVCPALGHPVWDGIDSRRDIVIELTNEDSQNSLISCRKHGPRS
jgi:hypothetical protein